MESTGLGAGLLALFAWPSIRQLPLGQPCFLTQLAVTLALAAVAGFVAPQFAPWKAIPKFKAPGVGGRMGLRAGLIAGLVAGAVFVVAAVVHVLFSDYADTEGARKPRMWTTLFVALAGVLPGVFIGFLGGSLASMIRQKWLPEGVPLSEAVEEAKPEPAWLGWLSRILTWLTFAAFLLPVFMLLKAAKPDRPVPPPPPPPPPPVVEPPPPPWRYEKPAGLATASPLDFVIVARRDVPPCVPGAPLCLSPSGRWLAFCPSESPSVAIMDLDFATVSRTYSLEATPTALSWAPDSTRLLVLNQTTDFGERLTVAFAEEDKALVLPRPKNRDLPRGPIYWARDTEAVFFPDDEPFLTFDLDQLRIHPLSESKTFVPTDEWNPEKQFRPPVSASWQFHASAASLSVHLAPRRLPETKPVILRRNCFAIGSPDLTVSRTFPEVGLANGVGIASAKDGSKVVRIQDGKAEILYFGLHASQPSQFTLSMPTPKEDSAKAQTVAKTLEGFALCAMVYSPMRNPLTNTIIGPDRERPLGILRFASWNGDTASLWLAEMSSHVSQYDVVADVHQWIDGEFVVSPLLSDPFWWASLGKGNPDGGALPAAKPLDTSVNLTISRREDSFVTFGPSQAKPIKRPELEAPPTGLEPPDSDPDESRVREFVLAHHDRASNGDIAGLGRDYADEVDFLGKRKTRDEILAETRAYQAKWPTVSESIITPITVKRSGNDYQATYTVKFRTESADGEWSEGSNDLTLVLRIANGTIEIIRQNARVYGRQSSASNAPERDNPPAEGSTPEKPELRPIKIVLAGPVWVYRQSNRVDDNRTELLDAVKIANNRFEYQKTFRTISPSGRVFHQQTAVIKGNVTRDGEILSLYFAELGWRGSDEIGGQNKQMMRMLESKVGQFLRFRIQGQDLYCIDFPGLFKRAGT